MKVLKIVLSTILIIAMVVTLALCCQHTLSAQKGGSIAPACRITNQSKQFVIETFGHYETVPDLLQAIENYAAENFQYNHKYQMPLIQDFDFDAFIEIIDELGGVDFEVPFDMVYDDPVQGLHINLKKGMQHLNGKQSHDFVRFRQGNPGYKGYAMGDLGRIEAQQKFIRALAEQKLKPQYLLKAGDIFATVKKNVRTNYSAKDLVKHLGTISSVISGDIKVHQMPGRTAMIGGGSYVVCDDMKMAELVREYFYPTDKKDEKEASDKNK